MNALVASTALSLFLGAACGSVPFGYLVGRVRRMDIRAHGSGNIGFTNVQRTLGWTWALPVLILDIAKGLVPTALAPALGLSPAFVGLGAILGHVFTPWLRFRGGKGVATTIGVAAWLCPRSLLAGLALYLAVLLATGFISLSSLTFAGALPPLTAVLYPANVALLSFTIGVAFVIFIRHHSNMARLAARTEPRLGLWRRLFHRS